MDLRREFFPDILRMRGQIESNLIAPQDHGVTLGELLIRDPPVESFEKTLYFKHRINTIVDDPETSLEVIPLRKRKRVWNVIALGWTCDSHVPRLLRGLDDVTKIELSGKARKHPVVAILVVGAQLYE
jgi:hypothetical protein